MIVSIPITVDDPRIKSCAIQIDDAGDINAAGEMPAKLAFEFEQPVTSVEFDSSVAVELMALAKVAKEAWVVPSLKLVRVQPWIEQLRIVAVPS